jgi:hypothetical protein
MFSLDHIIFNKQMISAMVVLLFVGLRLGLGVANVHVPAVFLVSITPG